MNLEVGDINIQSIAGVFLVEAPADQLPSKKPRCF